MPGGLLELTAIALIVTLIQNTSWPRVIVSREKHGGREWGVSGKPPLWEVTCELMGGGGKGERAGVFLAEGSEDTETGKLRTTGWRRHTAQGAVKMVSISGLLTHGAICTYFHQEGGFQPLIFQINPGPSGEGSIHTQTGKVSLVIRRVYLDVEKNMLARPPSPSGYLPKAYT